MSSVRSQLKRYRELDAEFKAARAAEIRKQAGRSPSPGARARHQVPVVHVPLGETTKELGARVLELWMQMGPETRAEVMDA